MIEHSVVLVLGAGASKPYGFPTGKELRDVVLSLGATVADHEISGHLPQGVRRRDLMELRDKLQKERARVDALLQGLGVAEGILSEFLSDLIYSPYKSIDAFLEHRKEYVDLGKALIAYYLIQCEKSEMFAPEAGDWYQYLFGDLMMDSKNPDAFVENKLTVITYNYDRSFEFRMLKALKAGFNWSVKQCAEALQRIPIIHLHGQLGSLTVPGAGGRPYEPKPSQSNIELAMKGIRIVSDPANVSEFSAAHKALAEAEKVIFLGFGFLYENIDRLRLSNLRNNNTRYFGSAKGKTPSEVALAESFFPRPAGMKIVALDCEMDALDFIRHNLQHFLRM